MRGGLQAAAAALRHLYFRHLLPLSSFPPSSLRFHRAVPRCFIASGASAFRPEERNARVFFLSVLDAFPFFRQKIYRPSETMRNDESGETVRQVLGCIIGIALQL